MPFNAAKLILALDPSDVQRCTHVCGRVRYSGFKPDQMLDHGDGVWQARLAEPMTFELDDLSITLPAGFWWDGASIKYRYVNAAIPRWGVKASMGSGPHDGLFTDLRHLIPDQDHPFAWANGVMYRFWRAAGMNWARASAGHRAVTWFGKGIWDRGSELGFGSPAITKSELIQDGRHGDWLQPSPRRAT